MKTEDEILMKMNQLTEEFIEKASYTTPSDRGKMAHSILMFKTKLEILKWVLKNE